MHPAAETAGMSAASGSRPAVGAARWNVWACALVVLRSEEHTSELQSHVNLVCRLLLEKKKEDVERWLPRSLCLLEPDAECRPRMRASTEDPDCYALPLGVLPVSSLVLGAAPVRYAIVF